MLRWILVTVSDLILSGQLSLIWWDAMVDKGGWHVNNEEYVCATLAKVVLICSPICYLDGISVPGNTRKWVWCHWTMPFFLIFDNICVRVNLKLRRSLWIARLSRQFIHNHLLIFNSQQLIVCVADKILRGHMSVSWNNQMQVYFSMYIHVYMYLSLYVYKFIYFGCLQFNKNTLFYMYR